MEKKRKSFNKLKNQKQLNLNFWCPESESATAQSDRILSLLCIKAPVLFAALGVEIKSQLCVMPEVLKNHIRFELESESITEHQIEELTKTILNTNFIH